MRRSSSVPGAPGRAPRLPRSVPAPSSSSSTSERSSASPRSQRYASYATRTWRGSARCSVRRHVRVHLLEHRELRPSAPDRQPACAISVRSPLFQRDGLPAGVRPGDDEDESSLRQVNIYRTTVSGSSSGWRACKRRMVLPGWATSEVESSRFKGEGCARESRPFNLELSTSNELAPVRWRATGWRSGPCKNQIQITQGLDGAADRPADAATMSVS